MKNWQIFFQKVLLFYSHLCSRNLYKKSVNEFDINPLHSVSLLGFTPQCDLKNTDVNTQSFQNKYIILLLEIIIRGRNSSVMSGRYVKSDDIEKKYVYWCY